ncbi:TetR/AcrR family transcriptional regulator [Streptomyces xanthii]|uniref:TetR family transcriptional regulator n=1 Tax=Streptomyces xanthii TaxID=2768069 RepID=A0A7H1B1B6_9ACTN|nr:TetR/AcrR family transcriptional regulator [Streptomyces xanthii]QNS02521.1 TetR family transcriptional regulator [Streptomyces xanthii]
MKANEGVGTQGVDRRQLKALRTREALAEAAVELVLEKGLAAVTVEAIAERADVTRRTFSRHFTGKEDAALDFTRADGAGINAALRERPADEPPLLAYRRAVADWLTDRDTPGWHHRPRLRELYAVVDEEPALFAAYERIRVDAQEESVRIIADRLGTDPARDPLPGIVVGAAAGVLTAALRTWARGAGSDAEDLADLVARAYDALFEEAARAAAADHATRE